MADNPTTIGGIDPEVLNLELKSQNLVEKSIETTQENTEVVKSSTGVFNKLVNLLKDKGLYTPKRTYKRRVRVAATVEERDQNQQRQADDPTQKPNDDPTQNPNNQTQPTDDPISISDQFGITLGNILAPLQSFIEWAEKSERRVFKFLGESLQAVSGDITNFAQGLVRDIPVIGNTLSKIVELAGKNIKEFADKVLIKNILPALTGKVGEKVKGIKNKLMGREGEATEQSSTQPESTQPQRVATPLPERENRSQATGSPLNRESEGTPRPELTSGQNITPIQQNTIEQLERQSESLEQITNNQTQHQRTNEKSDNKLTNIFSGFVKLFKGFTKFITTILKRVVLLLVGINLPLLAMVGGIIGVGIGIYELLKWLGVVKDDPEEQEQVSNQTYNKGRGARDNTRGESKNKPATTPAAATAISRKSILKRKNQQNIKPQPVTEITPIQPATETGRQDRRRGGGLSSANNTNNTNMIANTTNNTTVQTQPPNSRSTPPINFQKEFARGRV